jgi:hypothetical protein
MRKLWAPKVRGSRTQNNKPQPILEHPKISFLCCFIVIIVQNLFVEIKMALLQHFKSSKNEEEMRKL